MNTATSSALKTLTSHNTPQSEVEKAEAEQSVGPTEWNPRPVGLGPWAEEHPGQPLPDDPRYDPVLLAEGDRRNVVDHYRYWRREAIVEDLDTDRYQHLRHHPAVDHLLKWARENGLVVVAIDNTPGCVPLETTDLPRNCLLLFGQEGPGVTEAAQQGALMTCSIAQFGSTRSINAGVAAGIAMHAWIRQHADYGNSW